MLAFPFVSETEVTDQVGGIELFVAAGADNSGMQSARPGMGAFFYFVVEHFGIFSAAGIAFHLEVGCLHFLQAGTAIPLYPVGQ